MTCAACQRMNLPGGVRCVYCGVPLPPAPDFDLGAPPEAVPAATVLETTDAKKPTSSARGAGLLGLLLLLALKGKSLLGLLKFGKIATTLSSMLVFIWADAALFGWKFGVGIGVCILVHEMGHIFVGWRKGLPQSAPMFIPFVGAVIFIKQFPDDPAVQAESGAGGPAAGALAAFACLLLAFWTRNPFWLALANIGFLINLFNLIPFPPLDGSHMMTALSPRLWDGVLVGMLLWALKAPSGMLWMVLIVGFLLRLGRGHDTRYLLARPVARARMALIYLVLCLALSYGAEHTMHARSLWGYDRTAGVTTTAAQPAHTSQDQAAPTNPNIQAVEHALAAPVRIAALALGMLLWPGTGLLLASAAGRRPDGRAAALAGVMAGTGALLYAVFHLSPLVTYRGALVGAFFASSVAALIYAAYQAVYRRDSSYQPSLPALTARALAWAAGAALVVAYATEVPVIAGAVLFCTLAYYAFHPWMPTSLAGSLAEQAGEIERSIVLRRRALAMRPDSESAAVLWHDIARQSLRLARGHDALEAIRQREANMGASSAGTIEDLNLRAGALNLAGRFEEAVACCESLLHAPPITTPGPLRLLLARVRLAEMARLRGWPDEARAQAEAALSAVSGHVPGTIAYLRGLRAAALAALDQTEEARVECDRALKTSRDSYSEAWIATVRAQACLRDGNAAGALAETERAMRRLPANLETRYWRGRALVAAGRTEEGQALLLALAGDFPMDHWGHRTYADAPVAVPDFIVAQAET